MLEETEKDRGVYPGATAGGYPRGIWLFAGRLYVGLLVSRQNIHIRLRHSRLSDLDQASIVAAKLQTQSCSRFVHPPDSRRAQKPHAAEAGWTATEQAQGSARFWLPLAALDRTHDSCRNQFYSDLSPPPPDAIACPARKFTSSTRSKWAKNTARATSSTLPIRSFMSRTWGMKFLARACAVGSAGEAHRAWRAGGLIPSVFAQLLRAAYRLGRKKGVPPAGGTERASKSRNKNRGVFMPADRKAHYEMLQVNGFPCPDRAKRRSLPSAFSILRRRHGGSVRQGGPPRHAQADGDTGCVRMCSRFIPFCTEHCITETYDMVLNATGRWFKSTAREASAPAAFPGRRARARHCGA